MTTFKQDFEAGTVGSSVVTGSAGNGNTAIAAIGTAPLVTATAGEVIADTKSAKCSAAAGAASGVNLPVTMTTDGGAHFVVTLDAAMIASTVDEPIHQWRIAAASRIAVTLRASDKKIIVVDPSGTWASPSAATAGTYAVDVAASTGTTATAPYDGKNKWRFTKYSDGSFAFGTTAIVEQFNRNLGAGGSITNFYVGALGTTGTPARAPIVDEFYAIDSYAFTGPATTNAPPTVTGPSTISVTGTTANITFAATDSTGVVSSFSCVHQSNTAASTVTPTVGSPTLTGIGTGSATATFPISGLTANARYFFGGTATDSTGATSTTPVIARVDVTSTVPALRPGTTTTGYTIVGGGTATQALSAGTPGSRYLQSAAPAAGSTGSATFEPLPPGAVPVAFSVTGHATDATTSLTRTVRLYQSTTLIATRTGTINPTTDTTIGGTTNTSETAAITDRSGLRVDWVVS